MQYTLTNHGIAKIANLEGVKSCSVRLCFSLQSSQLCQIAMKVQGFYLRNLKSQARMRPGPLHALDYHYQQYPCGVYLLYFFEAGPTLPTERA